MKKLIAAFRFSPFVLLAILFYLLAWTVSDYHLPSTVLWKAGNATSGAYLGYWIDRHAFKGVRVGVDSPAAWHIRRAVIIAAVVLAVSLGL